MLEQILEYKRIRMTIPEFLQYQRGELTLKEIYFNRKTRRVVDNILNKIINCDKTRASFIFFLACCFVILDVNKVLAEGTSVDVSSIDRLGYTLLSITRSLGYWVCIILACKEIITELMSGGKDIGKIFVKYIIAFGSLYALPWVMDMIKSIIV